MSETTWEKEWKRNQKTETTNTRYSSSYDIYNIRRSLIDPFTNIEPSIASKFGRVYYKDLFIAVLSEQLKIGGLVFVTVITVSVDDLVTWGRYNPLCLIARLRHRRTDSASSCGKRVHRGSSESDKYNNSIIGWTGLAPWYFQYICIVWRSWLKGNFSSSPSNDTPFLRTSSFVFWKQFLGDGECWHIKMGKGLVHTYVPISIIYLVA